MGPTNYPNVFPVSTTFYTPRYLTASPSRYLTLFVVYTPYTIYKCKLAEEPDALWLTPSILDGFLGWGKMVVRDGWKCG